jgi:hypothetical protein
MTQSILERLGSYLGTTVFHTIENINPDWVGDIFVFGTGGIPDDAIIHTHDYANQVLTNYTLYFTTPNDGYKRRYTTNMLFHSDYNTVNIGNLFVQYYAISGWEPTVYVKGGPWYHVDADWARNDSSDSHEYGYIMPGTEIQVTFPIYVDCNYMHSNDRPYSGSIEFVCIDAIPIGTINNELLMIIEQN